jgi:hypothetical protein
MAKESDTSSRLSNSEILMKKIIFTTQKQVTLDGLMTIGMLENGLHSADFTCCEDVELDAFSGTFKVQGMRDGNVYMTEKPKRQKNKPLFRDDNSSLSLGRDGKYYFVFTLPEQLVAELPEQLVRQASAIAQKVIRELICR